MAAQPNDAARVAGRGVLWIAAAKAYFMVAGYAIEFVLPRLLTLPVFGAYKVVIGLVSVVNNMVVTGTIQSVGKFAAERDEQVEPVKRAALRVQAFVGGGLALGYLLAAPLLAAFERDPSLTPFIRLSSAIILCYAFYAVFVGAANGQRRFDLQARLDIGYATLRALLILGLAGVGLGLAGAVAGMAVAAGIILVVAIFAVGVGPASGTFSGRRLLSFMGGLFLYTLLLNLLLLSDLFLLKRLAAPLAPAGADPATYASGQSALYAAAQTLARIPYQGILAIAFVVFPMISRATFDQDAETTRAYIRQTMRASLLFCAALACVFAANPTPVLRLLYPAQYRDAAAALTVLAPGQVLFSLAAIANTLLNGAGRTRYALAVVALSLTLAIGGNLAAVPLLGPRLGAPLAAAWATSLANAVGFAAGAVVLGRLYGAVLAPATVARVAAAFAAAVAVGRLLPDGGKLWTLLECAAAGLTYLLTLVVLREFGPEDRARFARVLRRR